MPVRNGETVYVGASFTWEIPAVTLRGALMTASNPPDTFTFTVMLGSATSAQGSMTHGSPQGTWEATITGLSTAGEYHLHAIATKGTSVGKFHDVLTVSAFT
jgi:hypothetical protein